MSMFRTTLRALAPRLSTPARTVTAAATTIARPLPRLGLPQQSAAVVSVGSLRFYSAPVGLQREEVEGRIVDLLKGFEKVTKETPITGQSHFSNDLGLDSLDTVEVVMAIEEEFSIEIPDKEADKIQSVGQAVEYITSQPDAH